LSARQERRLLASMRAMFLSEVAYWLAEAIVRLDETTAPDHLFRNVDAIPVEMPGPRVERLDVEQVPLVIRSAAKELEAFARKLRERRADDDGDDDV
jgi:hypothetical protein